MHRDDGSAGPHLEVQVYVVVAEVIHVLFGHCLLLFCEGEVSAVTVFFERGEAVLEVGLGVLGGLFDGVGVGVFTVILLCTLDLETADGVEVVGMALLLLEGVLIGDFLWMAVMLLGLFLMMS